MTNKPQTLKGFRDFLPEDMRVREKVISTIKEVFRSFGFEPLETPALEYASVLLNKYGEGADRSVYTFRDRGGREIGLRYDLTVPVSRVLAQYQNEIKLPFKRYQIQKVWRTESPQKGRYREFTQCDIDIFGVKSPLADAEIINVIYEVLKKLGFEEFSIKINSRQALFKILEELGLEKQKDQLSVLQSIDKLEKKGKEGVDRELEEKGFSQELISKIFKAIENAKPDNNLKRIFEFLRAMGVSQKFYEFDPTLVRGLDYYTGPIFETVVKKPKIGSITGGGRYDKLIAQLGGPSVLAVGTTIGLDRICDVIKEQGLLKKKEISSVDVIVSIFNKELARDSVEILSTLRTGGLKAEIYLDPDVSLRRQLAYANSKNIALVAIMGPEEKKRGEVIIKDMRTKTQESVKLGNLLQEIKRRI